MIYGQAILFSGVEVEAQTVSPSRPIICPGSPAVCLVPHQVRQKGAVLTILLLLIRCQRGQTPPVGRQTAPLRAGSGLESKTVKTTPFEYSPDEHKRLTQTPPRHKYG